MIRLIKLMMLISLVPGYLFSQPLSGKKTIGATGTYTTIQAAINALVANGISGTVNFAIQPGTYDEGINLTASITGLTGTREINFAPTSGTVIWKAAPVSGISSSASLRLGANKRINFTNITFDLDTTGSSGYGVYFDGTADSVSFTGCTFTNSKSTNGYGIRASVSNTLGKLTVSNCIFSGLGTGIFYDKTANVVLPNSNFTINNNTFSNINSIALSFKAVGKIIVTGNTISDFTGSGFYFGYGFVENVSNNILYSSSGGSGSAVEIANKQKNAGYFGKFHNNMISMINRTGSIYGIYLNNYDSLQIIHNTISLSSNNSSTSLRLNQFLGNNYTQIKNNIFQQDQGTVMFFPANPNDRDITSDYNNYISTGTFSFITVVATGYSFANFQSNFSQDPNSKNKPVTYISSSDLHLSGSSLGDHDLMGTYLSDYATDIDGDARTPVSTYMGADEANGFALPVEMTSLNYSSTENQITINWTTKTETNNYGWEIESRGTGNKIEGTWRKIGFVKGSGTTTTPKSYSFELSKSSKLIDVRLKQIDSDGQFSYSNTLTIEAEPETFELLNNYPNPFNPSTEINYHLSINGRVELKIYDLLGREVKTLVNEEKSAGKYSVRFDASGFSSGVYLYQLKAGNQIISKKMILSK